MFVIKIISENFSMLQPEEIRRSEVFGVCAQQQEQSPVGLRVGAASVHQVPLGSWSVPPF